MKNCTIWLLCLIHIAGFSQISSYNKDTPEAAIVLSETYLSRADWFTDMPQYNSDSAKYYAAKALDLLDPNEPLHKSKWFLMNFKQMKRSNNAYPFSGQDSVTQIAWKEIEKLDLDDEQNRYLQMEFLAYWAEIKLMKGDRAGSLSLISQALVLLKEHDSSEMKAKLELHKGLYYAKYGLPEERKLALTHLHNSLSYYGKAGAEKYSSELYMIYAELVYQHTGQNQDSVYYYYDRVRSVLKDYQKPLAHIWYYSMMGYELIAHPKAGHDSVPETQYEEARENIVKAIHILEIYGMKKNGYYPYCFQLLADIDVAKNNYDASLGNFTKAYELYMELDDHYHATHVLDQLAEGYKKKGDLVNALHYKEQFYAESLKSEKEKNDRSLRENELQVNVLSQKQELEDKANQQKIFIVVMAMGLLLLGLIFYNYRLKQKSSKRLAVLNHDLENKNTLLDKRNAENELLLKEIHHRVKNNLEVVSSLLALQSSQIDDENIKEAMQEGQNRVNSIGIVHQKLYQGENLGAIEMKDYFLNLSASILDTFGADQRIRLEVAMDKLNVDIDTAVPLGLIVNELLTNTLKYAFPEGKEGHVRIKLEQQADGILHLEVADNGTGKSGATQGTGFGSQLINLLTRQLNGVMREEILNGTRILFDFKQEKLVLRV